MSKADHREVDLLLDEIRDEMLATGHLTGCSALEQRVFEVLSAVPRHAFVPEELVDCAYANHPLPIGHGQTISQPYIVALMTALIQPEEEDVVLEVGTGSGYQAAILSRLVKQVYSLEIIDTLAAQASQRLQQLGYDNVEVCTGNGHLGWPEHAPYDAIVVTAAAPSVPRALIEQLKPGGTLIIPVGGRHFGQDLLKINKDEYGRLSERSILPVIFVPLTGSPAN